MWPTVFERHRRVILTAGMIAVKENIQREVEVVHLVAHTLTDLSGELASVVDRDNAFRYPMNAAISSMAVRLPNRATFHRKDSVHATSTFRTFTSTRSR